MIRVSAIVARAENGVIGRDNQLPWYLPSDLKYFKAQTFGKPVVMGRKTFESIGRPLPGRTNVVITRQPDWQSPGVKVASSIEDALKIATAQAELDGADAVMLIGGAEIYRLGAPYIDRWYITEVHLKPDGDAALQDLDMTLFAEVSSQFGQAQPGEPDHTFRVFDRR